MIHIPSLEIWEWGLEILDDASITIHVNHLHFKFLLLSLPLSSFAAYYQDQANCTFNTVTITGPNQTVLVNPGVVCFMCDFGSGEANNSMFSVNFSSVSSVGGILVIPDSRVTFPRKGQPHNVLCKSFDRNMLLTAAVYLHGKLSPYNESNVFIPLFLPFLPFPTLLLSPFYIPSSFPPLPPSSHSIFLIFLCSRTSSSNNLRRVNNQ